MPGCLQASIIWSVYVLCTVFRRFFGIVMHCESCTRPISTNPASIEAGVKGLTLWDVVRRAPSQGTRGRRAAVVLVVCF